MKQHTLTLADYLALCHVLMPGIVPNRFIEYPDFNRHQRSDLRVVRSIRAAR
jgi:hypothetical protein